MTDKKSTKKRVQISVAVDVETTEKLDVYSLYPSMMLDQPLLYGKPTWRGVKENSTGGMREISKLHQNSLYGKIATKQV